MRVSELIDRLSKIENKNKIVFLSIDDEGNGFNELGSIQEKNCNEYLEEFVAKEHINSAVILWP